MKEYTLSEIATIKSGKRLPKGHELSNTPSPYPYIKAKDIKKGKVNSIGLEFVDESTRKKIAKYIVSENDVLITIVANIGDVGIVPKKLNHANLTENAVRLTNLKLFVDAQYLTYILSQKDYKEYMESLAAGAAQAKLGIYKIEKIKINLPELSIQKHIASILSAYDNLIEVNNQRIELLEQSARELYKEWFVRMRFPNYQNTKFNKGIPEGWKEKNLKEIADIIMGQSPKSEYYNENRLGLPFHQGVGSYGKRFPIHNTFCSDIKRIAKKGDILFSVRAPVGRLNIANENLIIGRGLAALKQKQNLNSFLFYLLDNIFKDEDIIGNGAIFNSVTKDELNKFKTLINDDLCILFDNITINIDKQIEILFKQNQELTAIRDRLLPRLISGKIEVKA